LSTRLTPDIARELCQRANSKAYIGGSIANIGSQYVVGLKAVNCLTGDVLAQEQATAAGKERVLDALGEAATKLQAQSLRKTERRKAAIEGRVSCPNSLPSTSLDPTSGKSRQNFQPSIAEL